MADTTTVAVPVVANASKLATLGRGAIVTAKALGGAAVSGVVMGTGLGVTIVAAGATAFGILWAAGTVMEKIEAKKAKSVNTAPSPA